jgi:hypothetical protein
VLLRHASPLKNLASIRRAGLLTSRSKGPRPLIWLHCPSRSAWAVLHTVRRHGGRAEAVVVLEVAIPRGWLRRARKGLWQCARDIPPTRLLRVIDFAGVSQHV